MRHPAYKSEEERREDGNRSWPELEIIKLCRLRLNLTFFAIDEGGRPIHQEVGEILYAVGSDIGVIGAGVRGFAVYRVYPRLDHADASVNLISSL